MGLASKEMAFVEDEESSGDDDGMNAGQQTDDDEKAEASDKSSDDERAAGDAEVSKQDGEWHGRSQAPTPKADSNGGS